MGLKALKEKNNRKVKHVKKNDRVVVLAGSDKGKQSRVIDERGRCLWRALLWSRPTRSQTPHVEYRVG